MTHKHTPKWKFFPADDEHDPWIGELGCDDGDPADECDYNKVCDVNPLDRDDAERLGNMLSAAPAMLAELETGCGGNALAKSLRLMAHRLYDLETYLRHDPSDAKWLLAKADSIEDVVRKATGGRGMTTYRPGDAVWATRKSDAVWRPAWYVREHMYTGLHVIRLYRGRLLRATTHSNLRPRDPSQNGKDKPND